MKVRVISQREVRASAGLPGLCMNDGSEFPAGGKDWEDQGQLKMKRKMLLGYIEGNVKEVDRQLRQ